MNDPLDQLRLRFTGLRLLTETGHGQVYVGHDFTGTEVTVAVLSEPAAADAGMRSAFGDAVWRYSPGSAPDQSVVYAADLHAARPWAAIRNPVGQPGAEQLLAALGAAPTTLAAPQTAPPTSLAGPQTGPAAQPPLPVPPPPPGAYPTSPPPMAQPPPPIPPGFGAPPAGFGAPQPAPPGVGYPPSVPAAAPPRSGNPWPALIAVAASVVVLIVLAGVAIVAMQALRSGDDDDPVVTGANPPPPPGPGPPAPATDAPQLPAGEPRLRDVEQFSLLGPTWRGDEDTYTMAFSGWPFAFRTPGSWGCLGGSFDPIPDALVWQCTDPGSRQRMNVMLWECPTSCTPEEQDDMIEAWLDHPEDAVRLDDPPVAYVEYENNDRGLYAIDLSHFGGAGGPLQWHIGVYVESPPDTADDVLKVLNDILSQSA